MNKKKIEKPAPEEPKILEWGHRVLLEITHIKPYPTKNDKDVVKAAGGRFGSKRRIITGKKAVAYIIRLRTGFYFCIEALQGRGGRPYIGADNLLPKSPVPVVSEKLKGIQFPLEGKKCPLRIEVYAGWAEDDRTRGGPWHVDLDSIVNGVCDALKVGPTDIPGKDWGIISDDRYITEIVASKCEAPEDDRGSRIVVVFSRSGLRAPKDTAEMIRGLQTFPPWRPEFQSKILKLGNRRRSKIILPGQQSSERH